jgi:phosphoribosyl-dephospho-CoA transferase
MAKNTMTLAELMHKLDGLPNDAVIHIENRHELMRIVDIDIVQEENHAPDVYIVVE